MDLGLLTGITSGANSFLEGYRTERAYQDKKKEDSQEKALKKRLMQAQLMGQGLEEDPSGAIIRTAEKRDQLDLDRKYKTAQIGKLEAEAKAKGLIDPLEQETKYARLGLLKAKTREADKAATAGVRLPADKVMAVQDGASVMRNLPEIRETIQANGDVFGPVMGMMGSINPYNEKSQTIDAQMRVVSQQFGRYMEGGVLRKEDEEKYRKMFPQLTDTPEIAANKLAIVERILSKKQSSDVSALKGAGYSTAGLETPDRISDGPEILAGGSRGLLNSQASGRDMGNQVKVVGGKTYRKVPGGWEEVE